MMQHASSLIPPMQELPAAWYGPQMAASSDEWTWQLGEAEIAEIESAADSFLARGGGPAVLEARDFPLPTVGRRLLRLRKELIEGRGFELLRGLPVHEWPREKAACAFLGLGAHVGVARSQNAAGHLLGHVRDLGKSSTDPGVRIYQTAERQTFHADSCDIVALACLVQAKAGGESLLVSTLTVYNELLRRGRSDLAEALLLPVAVDRRGEVPEGMAPFFLVSPVVWHAGKLGSGAGYQRQYIDSAQRRFPEAPRLSALQLEALDCFDALLDDPSLHFSMKLRPGDIQFVYNHALLHDRSGFTDHPEPHRRRHLLRLWLSPPGDRPLPESFAARFGSTLVGDRGGILCPGTEPSVPLKAAGEA
jgi:hypothetical protein